MDAPGPAPLHFTYSLRPTLCQSPTPTNGDQMTTILSESKTSPQIIYVHILWNTVIKLRYFNLMNKKTKNNLNDGVCLKLIRTLSFWELSPQSRPLTGTLPLDPTGDFRPPDHDSTQAGWGVSEHPLSWRIQCESKKVAPLKLFAVFSLPVNLCNWKLSWLLPKHISMFTPIFVHLSG